MLKSLVERVLLFAVLLIADDRDPLELLPLEVAQLLGLEDLAAVFDWTLRSLCQAVGGTYTAKIVRAALILDGVVYDIVAEVADELFEVTFGLLRHLGGLGVQWDLVVGGDSNVLFHVDGLEGVDLVVEYL